MLSIRFSGPIAQAVAGEISRIRLTQALQIREARRERRRPGLREYRIAGEGTAYKAAWDRQGSNALRHCDAFTDDVVLARAIVVSAPGRRVLRVAA